MAHAANELLSDDIDAYLDQHEHKLMLRFITCGSVDDGKSTLIGRLLYESKLVFDDQLTALEADSRKSGTQGEGLDFALLVDGLAAEREQGITIDVAYRYFTTERRKFVVADTPGHEQYTRNMVTGASTADLAVILVDSRKGILTQTRRHSYLVSLLGIKHVVLAVNKLDLVDYSQEVFDAITADYAEFAHEIGLDGFVAIPMSAYMGDNLTERSANTPWYSGPSLIEHLETVDIDDAAAAVHTRRHGHRHLRSQPTGDRSEVISSASAGSGQRESPPSANRRQSKRGPGSPLRSGAMSEWPITRAGGMFQRAMIAASSRSSAAICGSAKGVRPSLASSMPIERELTSVTPAHSPAPACHARRCSSTSASAMPVSEISQWAETSASGSQRRARASAQVAIAV